MQESLPTVQELFACSKEVLERNKQTGWPDLPDNKKLFAYSYLLDYDHRRAAEEFGYKASHGVRLLREPLLASFIDFLRAEQADRLKIDADMIKTLWMEQILILTGKQPAPRLLKDGTVMEVASYEPAAVVAALREMAKSTKFYENGSGNENGVSVSIDLSGLGIDPDIAKTVIIESSASVENSDDADEDGAPL